MLHNVQGSRAPSVLPGRQGGFSSKVKALRPTGEQPFQKILKQQMAEQEGLKFSVHALSRIQSRKIYLTREQLGKLNQAVAKAERKGARESLVLFSDRAFVVSVKNKTVITAIENEALKDKIFTNIDSAVIV